MTKVVYFTIYFTITASFPHIFLQITPFIAEADAVVANSTKTVLSKGTLTFIDGPESLNNKASINLPD